MAKNYIISAIFLMLVSVNMIQAGIIPQLFHKNVLPNLVNAAALPGIGELSHNFATSAASAASNTINGFRTYFDNFRTGFGQNIENIEIPPKYRLLHRIVHGEWPSLAGPAGQLGLPGFLGSQVGDSSSASAD